MALKFKEGVQLTATKAVNQILDAGVQVFDTLAKDCVVTAGRDGVHQIQSKHYTDEALDLRRFHLEPHEVEPVVQGLKQALGKDFDVVLEHDHLHVEYDPKQKVKGTPKHV